MTTSILTAPHLNSKNTIIDEIECGIAEIKAGRTISHEVAMASLQKLLNAKERPD